MGAIWGSMIIDPNGHYWSLLPVTWALPEKPAACNYGLRSMSCELLFLLENSWDRLQSSCSWISLGRAGACVLRAEFSEPG